MEKLVSQQCRESGHTFSASSRWKLTRHGNFSTSALEHPSCNVRGVHFPLGIVGIRLLVDISCVGQRDAQFKFNLKPKLDREPERFRAFPVANAAFAG